MEYSYEFVKVKPKQLYAQVRYFAVGHPDVFKNIIVEEVSEESLNAAAQSYAASVVATWQNIAAAPEELVLAAPVQSAVYTPATPPLPKETVQDPVPDFDPYTQRIERTYTETETEYRHGWEVIALTEEEQAAYLVIKAEQTVVTMRQARLALFQAGQLEATEVALNALPEPDKSAALIEWEYASTVARTSPWVIQLGPALGLDEVELDELFEAASEL